jgi:hypothetical protein
VRAALVGIIGGLFLLGTIIEAFEEKTPTGDTKTSVTGEYLGWVSIDSARGYALVSFTNTSSSEASLSCTVSVRTDFGNSGFDILTGTIDAGETIEQRVALTVTDNAAALVDSGEVECD